MSQEYEVRVVLRVFIAAHPGDIDREYAEETARSALEGVPSDCESVEIDDVECIDVVG